MDIYNDEKCREMDVGGAKANLPSLWGVGTKSKPQDDSV